MPLILSRAEIGKHNQLTRQFIFFPVEAVRALAGNLRALLPTMTQPLPVYEMLGEPLPVFDAGEVRLPLSQQVDVLLDLMSCVGNNTRNLDTLLTALIHNVPLIISNAPPDVQERANLVQGLLTLLPVSTRFGITFLLHSSAELRFPASIVFVDSVPDRSDAVLYDWQTRQVSGRRLDTSEYARFIVSQMRLDPEIALREADKLTPTAGWRFSVGDTLAKALDYASYRSKVDNAILNGLPVEAEGVARLLSEDSTMSDEMRLAYSRHLVNISLAVNNLIHLDAVTATMHVNSDLEAEIYNSLANALQEGRGGPIFDMLVRWYNNPFSPQSPDWTHMLHHSALARLTEMVSAEDAEGIDDFLSKIQDLGSIIVPVISRVLDQSIAFADRAPEIPIKLLLLAIRHLQPDKLARVMKSARFMQPQPVEIKRFLALLSRPDHEAVPGVLMRALRTIPDDARDAALVSFTKLAVNDKRLDLLDEKVLEELVRVAIERPNLTDLRMLSQIADAFDVRRLQPMKRGTARNVLQMHLITERYEQLAQAMVTQSRDLYRAEGQAKYIESVHDVFSETPMISAVADIALRTLEQRGIRDIPLIATRLGALHGAQYAADMQPHAIAATTALTGNARMLEVLPPRTVMSLLAFEVQHGNPGLILAAARLVASCCAYERGKDGLAAVNQAFKLLYNNDPTRSTALEVVRQYVREAPEKPARHTMKYYGEKLGAEATATLQTAYEFSNFLARMDWLTYASSLRIAVEVLQNIVNLFSVKNAEPSLQTLRQSVDRMRQALEPIQVRELVHDLRQLAHTAVILGQRHDQRSSNSDKHIENVVAGSTDPRSIVDVFRAAGGHLLENKVYPFRTQDPDATNPFGKGRGDEVAINVTIASNLLHQAINARPTGRDIWTAAAIFAEIDSQMAGVAEPGRDDMRQMGRDWQRLADLLIWMYKNSEPKVIEAGNSRGRKLDKHEIAPANPLELLRFYYGYLSL
jgi:hypothetical protein